MPHACASIRVFSRYLGGALSPPLVIVTCIPSMTRCVMCHPHVREHGDCVLCIADLTSTAPPDPPRQHISVAPDPPSVSTDAVAGQWITCRIILQSMDGRYPWISCTAITAQQQSCTRSSVACTWTRGMWRVWNASGNHM